MSRRERKKIFSFFLSFFFLWKKSHTIYIHIFAYFIIMCSFLFIQGTTSSGMYFLPLHMRRIKITKNARIFIVESFIVLRLQSLTFMCARFTRVCTHVSKRQNCLLQFFIFLAFNSFFVHLFYLFYLCYNMSQSIPFSPPVLHELFQPFDLFLCVFVSMHIVRIYITCGINASP